MPASKQTSRLKSVPKQRGGSDKPAGSVKPASSAKSTSAFSIQGVYGKESEGFPVKSLPKLPEQKGGAKTKTKTKAKSKPVAKPKTDPVASVASRAKGPIANQLLSFMRGSKTRPMRGGATTNGSFDLGVSLNMTNAMQERDPYKVDVSPKIANYTSSLDPHISINNVFDVPQLTNMSLLNGGGAKKKRSAVPKKKTVSKK